MGGLAVPNILRKVNQLNKANLTHRLVKKTDSSDNSGFTLLELLVVIGLVAVVSTIAGVSWLVFVNNQRLGTANDAALRAMREAQSQAEVKKLIWQASFRDSNASGDSVFQWAIHQALDDGETIAPNALLWNDVEENIAIDTSNTTLNEEDLDDDGTNDVWMIRFDHHGNVEQSGGLLGLGRITLISTTGGNAKRCTFVSTILGAMRTDSDSDCIP